MDETKIFARLPRTLRNLKEKNGYTQKQIADILAVSQSYYGGWEYDATDMPLRYLGELASLYKMTVIDLLTYESKDDTPLSVAADRGEDYASAKVKKLPEESDEMKIKKAQILLMDLSAILADLKKKK